MRLSKTTIRDFADRLYSEALDACCESYTKQRDSNTTAAAVLNERSATKKAIANQLYSILDAKP